MEALVLNEVGTLIGVIPTAHAAAQTLTARTASMCLAGFPEIFI